MRANARACEQCRAELCQRELLMSRILGFKPKVLCHRCLADALGQPTAIVVSRVLAYVRMRGCWYRLWQDVAHCDHDGGKPCCPSRLGR